MKVELTEEGYTLDGKWLLVPVELRNIPRLRGQREAINQTGNPLWLSEVYSAILRASPKPDLSGLQSVKGIHVGGELLPEFNSDNGIYY